MMVSAKFPDHLPRNASPLSVVPTLEELADELARLEATDIPDVPLRDPVECSICHQVMCEPVTAQCSHSFCRQCLAQHSLQASAGRLCPVCQEPVDIPDPATHPVNKDLDARIRAVLHPDVVDARIRAASSELEDALQSAGPVMQILVGELDLDVGMTLTWHAIKSHEKAIVTRAWTSNRQFVFCPSAPTAGMAAVVVEMLDACFFPDGQVGMKGVGINVVFLGEIWEEKGTAGLLSTRVYFNPRGAARPPRSVPRRSCIQVYLQELPHQKTSGSDGGQACCTTM
mmetsp:Transcript_35477/g.110673  ORF Transcript_35477/g.110673 Transcript_35477/m.110673 type:complete len:285 (+) Transcript_35477:36-890(+)